MIVKHLEFQYLGQKSNFGVMIFHFNSYSMPTVSWLYRVELVEQHWAPTRLIYEDTSTGIYQRHALYHWIGNFV